MEPLRSAWSTSARGNNAASNRHYEIPHADILDLNATTGWARGCFVRLSQNAGSSFPSIIDAEAGGGNPYLNLYSAEATVSGADNCYGLAINDGSTSADGRAAADTTVLNQLTLVVVQLEAGAAKVYRCFPGAAATLLLTHARPFGTFTAQSNWHFGARADHQTARTGRKRRVGCGVSTGRCPSPKSSGSPGASPRPPQSSATRWRDGGPSRMAP